MCRKSAAAAASASAHVALGYRRCPGIAGLDRRACRDSGHLDRNDLGGLRGGTRTGLVVTADGSLQLASEMAWTKAGMVLDVGPQGSPDSVWARNPFVLREPDGTYKMWYQGFDGSRNRILLATSEDGIAWVKQGVVLDFFESNSGPFVRRDGDAYHMWFKGGVGSVGQIYHAVSPDGRAWTLDALALSVGPPGAWDGLTINNPWVVQVGGTNMMYYSGADGVTERIGLAASSGYVGFVRLSPAPVLDLGAPGGWDSSIVRVPAVVPGLPWVMYYAGLDGSGFSLGIATSSDGISWTKATTNPFLTPDPFPAWDYRGMVGAAFLDDPSGPRLYYTGSDGINARVGLVVGTQQFVPSGSYVSRVFDSGYGTAWSTVSWSASIPMGTSITIYVRAGNRASPDGSWTDWQAIPGDGSEAQLRLPRFRYLQYRADFTTTDPSLTSILHEVTITFLTGRGSQRPA